LKSEISVPSIPLSALQHLLYCERQCALIHLEQEWTENRFTAEGRVLHERAHEGPDESRPGIRIARGLRVQSETLGLHGICDVVEFHTVPSDLKSQIADLKCTTSRVVPVEYKRGKPKSHRADEVQLCGQAMCLEETFGVAIPEGFLFYGKPRRRTVVRFDAELRKLVADCVQRLCNILQSGMFPPPVYEKTKCGACSLYETCQPRTPASAKAWFANILQSENPNLKSEIQTP
jgi:CRISPR-associated exonuclease Cas4